MEVEQKRRMSLVTLMGLPGSGKTTLCQNLIKFHFLQPSETSNSTEIILFQYDSFIPLPIQSQFIHQPNLAKILRSNFLKLISNFVQLFLRGAELTTSELETGLSSEFDEIHGKSALSSALLTQVKESLHQSKSDIILLIDDNNYYKSMRNDFYQIAKNQRIGFCLFYTKSTVTICQERNLQRDESSQVPSSIIVDMDKKLEEPNPMGNPADVFSLQISDVLDDSTHQLIYTTLLQSLQNPVCPNPDNSVQVAKDRRICAENEIHQADIILRKWIHTELTLASFGAQKASLRKLSQEYQSKKSKVLDGLRSGEIQVMANIGDEYEFRKEILSICRKIQ